MFPRSKMVAVLMNPLQYYQKVKNLLGSSIIAYWPLWEAAGSVANDVSGNARNGAYGADAAAPTLGQPGIGDGRTCPSFDGGDYVNVYSAALNAAFSGAEGTLSIWVKVSGAGVWADGALRYIVRLAVNATNYISIVKPTIANRLDFNYEANDILETYVLSTTATGWMNLTITWSKAAEQVIYYLDSTPLETDTDLGVWSGNLSTTATCLGASNTTPALAWSGYLAHALLLNRPATPTEVATIAYAPFLV